MSTSDGYRLLFHSEFCHAHRTQADVAATARCFYELVRLGVM